MLDYEWGNPSSVLLSGEESTQDSDRTRQIFDQYNQTFSENFHAEDHALSPQNLFQQQQQQQQQNQTQLQTFYNSNNYTLSYPAPPPAPIAADSVTSATGFMLSPKNEEIYGQGRIDFPARIGLNLGGRTYFSSEDDFMNQLYRRTRPLESSSSNTPRCQAAGCNADLTHSKNYHRRHKVCEFHSKASTVLIAGLTQRFCQQCSRFHLLPEFDQGKRSCRKRLADHNRRRRKSQPQQQLENTQSSPSENPERSSPESGLHSSSSVTLAVSPPRMSLGCFLPTNNQASISSTAANSFFSPVCNFRSYERQISSWDEEEDR